jgi:DNA-binding NtrC family response regulator
MNRDILFVDDDANLLNAYQRQLRKLFNVSTALSGPEGLATMRTKSFAVVVSDMRMPGMNGLEFLAKVREIEPGAIRIILTGNADLAIDNNRVNSDVFFRILNKPCSRDCLTASLQEAIDEFARRSATAQCLPAS